jgi:hypothetical protein
VSESESTRAGCSSEAEAASLSVMKCLGHEALRGHVQYVYGNTAVPFSLSLGTQAGRLENLHKRDTMIVEKVAMKGRHTITRLGARVVERAATWGP